MSKGSNTKSIENKSLPTQGRLAAEANQSSLLGGDTVFTSFLDFTTSRLSPGSAAVKHPWRDRWPDARSTNRPSALAANPAKLNQKEAGWSSGADKFQRISIKKLLISNSKVSTSQGVYLNRKILRKNQRNPKRILRENIWPFLLC